MKRIFFIFALLTIAICYPQAVYAQGVTPVFNYLVPCPTCASPNEVPISGGGSQYTAVTSSPDAGPITSSPNVTPCSLDTSHVSDNARHGGHRKHKGQISNGMEQILQFLLELINKLLQLLGGGQISTPETSPEAVVGGGIPNPNPCDRPAPSAAAAVPSQAESIPAITISQPPTVSTAPVAANPADRIFTEDFEAGNLNQWSNQSCPTGVTIVTSPARKGTHAAKFTVADGDTNAKCPNVPTENPRAQLVTKGLFKDGDDYFIGLSMYFPTGFPAPTDWFQVAEIYGEPFGGSPSMEFDVKGTKLAFSRDKTHGYDTPWTATHDIVKDKWEDLVIHVKFSSDPNTGFVEIWDNGVQQTFTNGTQKLMYNTLVNGINWQPGGTNAVHINQYRSASSKLGTVTLYEDEIYVGKTYASVAR
jgi:hypothetical protein